MKDFVVSNPGKNGLIEPSILSFKVGRGIELLVEKLTKFLYTVPKDTYTGFIDGLNIRELAQMNDDPFVIQDLQLAWSVKLIKFEEQVKKTTSVNAPQSERLSKLIFNGIVYDRTLRCLKVQITIVPEAGSPQQLEYPVQT